MIGQITKARGDRAIEYLEPEHERLFACVAVACPTCDTVEHGSLSVMVDEQADQGAVGGYAFCQVCGTRRQPGDPYPFHCWNNHHLLDRSLIDRHYHLAEGPVR